ncbi:YigZ family protein [Stenotrophomonas sp. BIGb0135]|uniref:IMPACT family protein n=1 Tax=Stenotrophomonas sp. BIGb0135 TaxID=2940620 RepID=UPI002169BBA5|nr:YigZ family protein [Stenotrophomonas sp. BIGb0135]MCS4235952.1 putative YigZ family protein [Stenotrophomonas sp. BIGb0135]
MPDTLATVVSHSLEIKHSRFIAHAAPIDDAAAALAFLQQVAVADATHNCWAYRHGSEYRSSDDGEPAGTAGRPILAAIDGQGFDSVVVVVIRWYGGIKLGAGGLVRAYGGTAAECLRIAPRLPLVALATLRLQAGFDDLGALHAALAAHGAEKQAETFTASGVEMQLQLPADQADPLKNRLRDATRDRIRIETCTEPGHLND